MKINQKELASLQKKYDKVTDFKFLSGLYKQCDDDQLKLKRLEKENLKLQWEQRKAELKIAKKINTHTDCLISSEITH